MKKRTVCRKAVIMMLVLILMLSGVVNAMESEVGKRVVTINGEKIHVNILVDNEFERIVETEDQYTINITTFNKEKNYIVVEEINKITGEESITTADLNQIDFDLISSEDSGLEMHPCATILFSASSMFFQNKYYYWSDMYWGIYNSSGARKGVYENSSNSTDLIGFKDAVDDLREAEFSAIAAGGVAVVSAVVAVLTAPTGLGAVVGAVVAVGGAIGCAIYIWNMYRYRNSSNFYWSRV